jgi:hypothetical protein
MAGRPGGAARVAWPKHFKRPTVRRLGAAVRRVARAAGRGGIDAADNARHGGAVGATGYYRSRALGNVPIPCMYWRLAT